LLLWNYYFFVCKYQRLAAICIPPACIEIIFFFVEAKNKLKEISARHGNGVIIIIINLPSSKVKIPLNYLNDDEY